jgi:hypothetical protein
LGGVCDSGGLDHVDRVNAALNRPGRVSVELFTNAGDSFLLLGLAIEPEELVHGKQLTFTVTGSTLVALSLVISILLVAKFHRLEQKSYLLNNIYVLVDDGE